MCTTIVVYLSSSSSPLRLVIFFDDDRYQIIMAIIIKTISRYNVFVGKVNPNTVHRFEEQQIFGTIDVSFCALPTLSFFKIIFAIY